MDSQNNQPVTDTPTLQTPPIHSDTYRILQTQTNAIYLVDPLNQTIAEIYNAPDAAFICGLLNSHTREEDADTANHVYRMLGGARSTIGTALLMLDQLSCRQKAIIAFSKFADAGVRP